MLQRVQTIYLALAFISIALLLIFPVFIVSIGNDVYAEFNAYGFQLLEVEGTANNQPYYVLYIIMALFSAGGILLYKNRAKQILVVRIGLIIHVLVAVAFLLFSFLGKSKMIDKITDSGIDAEQVHYGNGIGYYLLFIAIPFLLLAIRGIRADDKLVKSLDRLR